MRTIIPAKAFPVRKVSVNQAVTLLANDGIYTDEDQAKTILDFLYAIAKTTAALEITASIQGTEGDIEHRNC